MTKFSAHKINNGIESIENESDKIDEEKDDTDLLPSLEERNHIPFRGLREMLDEKGDKFYRLMNDRRSIRKFNPKRSVDMTTIEKCILAAGEWLFKPFRSNAH